MDVWDLNLHRKELNRICAFHGNFRFVTIVSLRLFCVLTQLQNSNCYCQFCEMMLDNFASIGNYFKPIGAEYIPDHIQLIPNSKYTFNYILPSTPQSIRVCLLIADDSLYKYFGDRFNTICSLCRYLVTVFLALCVL